MDLDKSRYKYASELSRLRHKLISIKKEISELKHQKKMQLYKEKINRLIEIYRTVIKFLENIAEKREKAMLKIQEMSLSKSGSLPLPWKCYDDVISLFADIKKLKTLLEDPTIYIDAADGELDQYLEQLQEAIYILHKKIIECGGLLQSSKSFVANMAIIAEAEDLEKSDLGCYPHEKSDENEQKSPGIDFSSFDLLNNTSETEKDGVQIEEPIKNTD